MWLKDIWYRFLVGVRLMKRLEILTPADGAVVGDVIEVRGRVIPARLDVQLYVKSNDEQWYLQPRVERKGNRFVGTVHIGNTPPPPDGEYCIMAVATEKRPASPVREEKLPSGVRSAVVHVTRNA